jgi:hypothetical protein
MAKRGRKKKEIPGIDEIFLNEVNSMDTAARKARIVTMQFSMDESEDFLKNNEAILETKAELASLVGPSKETLKVLKNRTKYLIDQLNGKDTQDQGTA